MRRTLRVGIIGLGRVAWMLEDDPLRAKPCTHLGAWLTQPRVRVVAGCDIDPERRIAFKQRVPRAALYDDYRAMLACEDLDFVSICAYATERCEMVVAAAKAGVRGIWCEKAMATSMPEADRMGRALKRHGTAMIVSYVRRYEPLYHRVRGMLDDGAIGALQTINVHFSGSYFHTGTHAFDLLRWFGGEVQFVQAWLTDAPLADVAIGGRGVSNVSADWGGDAVVQFKSGARAFIHGRPRRYFRFELELLGDAGMIRIGNTQAEWWRTGPSHLHSGMQELEQHMFPPVASGNMWHTACSDLMAAVRDDALATCGWREGREAMAIALAAHESHHRGHVPVSVRENLEHLRVPSR